MDDQDITMFKDLLNERRRELVDQGSETANGMGQSREQFADPTDRGSLEGNRNLTLRIRDRERKLISKIDEALLRIEEGSYGVCDECGEEIGSERLKARPVTTLCITCKAEQEDDERRRHV
jgi:DnaK suppressor protein